MLLRLIRIKSIKLNIKDKELHKKNKELMLQCYLKKYKITDVNFICKWESLWRLSHLEIED
jgi:hypothetical protein